MEIDKEFSFKTYSFIIYFKGVLYISQIRAITLNQAIKTWKHEEMLNLKKKLGLSKYEYTSIKEKILDDNPYLLNDISNVWCGDSGIAGKHFSLTIVLTNSQKIKH